MGTFQLLEKFKVVKKMKTFPKILALLLLFALMTATIKGLMKDDRVKRDSSILLEKATRELEKVAPRSLNNAPTVDANKYLVDTTHSSIQFAVRHWGIYNVAGGLESYEVKVTYTKDDFTDMAVEALLRPASVNMPNMEMAHHLKAARLGFFEVEKFQK